MIALAFDTATDRLSAAARRDDGPVAEASLDGARRHAAGILPLVEEVLRAVGASMADVTDLAVADGPGSFTGLRVGAAVAKALAREGGPRLWRAPSLMVRARHGARAGYHDVVAISNAMRDELYVGTYRFEASRVHRLVPEATLTLDQFLARPRPDVVVGDASPRVLERVRTSWPVPLIGPPEGLPRAADLLALVEMPGGADRVADVSGWEPIYGRLAEAQVKWEAAHGRPLPDSPGSAR